MKESTVDKLTAIGFIALISGCMLLVWFLDRYNIVLPNEW